MARSRDGLAGIVCDGGATLSRRWRYKRNVAAVVEADAKRGVTVYAVSQDGRVEHLRGRGRRALLFVALIRSRLMKGCFGGCSLVLLDLPSQEGLEVTRAIRGGRRSRAVWRRNPAADGALRLRRYFVPLLGPKRWRGLHDGRLSVRSCRENSEGAHLIEPLRPCRSDFDIRVADFVARVVGIAGCGRRDSAAGCLRESLLRSQLRLDNGGWRRGRSHRRRMYPAVIGISLGGRGKDDELEVGFGCEAFPGGGGDDEGTAARGDTLREGAGVARLVESEVRLDLVQRRLPGVARSAHAEVG